MNNSFRAEYKKMFAFVFNSVAPLSEASTTEHQELSDRGNQSAWERRDVQEVDMENAKTLFVFSSWLWDNFQKQTGITIWF